ncbi:MAG: AMP-binding protein [Actinomycetota bacterium]|nr:AMP-binding protein [Actinomycetota bacterium]MDQ3899369.1 AMP-binding protein [Actinomycetota bacterium]
MSGFSDQAAAVAAALAKLDVRPNDRVLILLPDSPDFAPAFAGVIHHGAVPLTVSPLLAAHEIMDLAAAAGARLILATLDIIDALAELDAKPPLLINGPYGCWAAVLPLH